MIPHESATCGVCSTGPNHIICFTSICPFHPFHILCLLQVPLRGSFLVIHTCLIAYLIHRGKDECKAMVTVNSDFRAFADQLEGLHTLWERGGPQPACSHLCGDLFDASMFRPSFVPAALIPAALFPAACSWSCGWTLPLFWRVYGKPWLQACVTHRFVMVVCPWLERT
jgi:hypothetical protein